MLARATSMMTGLCAMLVVRSMMVVSQREQERKRKKRKQKGRARGSERAVRESKSKSTAAVLKEQEERQVDVDCEAVCRRRNGAPEEKRVCGRGRVC